MRNSLRWKTMFTNWWSSEAVAAHRFASSVCTRRLLKRVRLSRNARSPLNKIRVNRFSENCHPDSVGMVATGLKKGAIQMSEDLSAGCRENRKRRCQRGGRAMLSIACLCFGSVFFSAALAAENRDHQKVLLLSIDGLKPEYVFQADEYGLEIPNLRKMVATGASAKDVKGVLPTSTFPGHITLITGVTPAKHGVYHNRPFDPAARVSGKRWDWLAEHIQVPTLWNQAPDAGRTTSGVGWPVSVGASDIHYNIPERVIGSESPEVWSVVTPGLIKEIGTKARARIDAGEVEFAKADWERTSYALEIIDAKKPDLIGVHLAAADSMQHRHGPFSKETIAALEEIDMMVGILTDAFRATDPGAIVCAASDHGFTSVDRVLRIDAAFERAGLITFESRGKTYADSEIGDWVAKQLPAGGSSPVFLQDPDEDR